MDRCIVVSRSVRLSALTVRPSVCLSVRLSVCPQTQQHKIMEMLVHYVTVSSLYCIVNCPVGVMTGHPGGIFPCLCEQIYYSGNHIPNRS